MQLIRAEKVDVCRPDGLCLQAVTDKDLNRYIAISSKYKLFFYHKKQANMCYAHGIKSRAFSLANAYLLTHIVFKDGDTIIDCGANVGDLKLYFIEKNLDIEYIGIEPSPLEYECLKLNVNPSKTFNIGLWNGAGQLDFYVSSQGADSSFITPVNFDEIKKIPTKRLDSLINKKIKLLKIEAEGAEPEVLEGCEDLLNNIEWISADLGFERGVEQTSTLAPVTNFLLSRNFELVEINHDRVVALFRNKALMVR